MCGEADNEDKIFMKSHINLVLDCDFKKKYSLASIRKNETFKGQLILKANCQAVNSSKKRMNKFVFMYCAMCFRSFFGRN